MSLPNFARYVGIPFKDHGRDEMGCDCWGLVRLVYLNEFGIELPDLGPLYKTTTDKPGMRKVYLTQLVEWRKVEDPRVGDVVLLRIYGVPIHVGIVCTEGKMLHIEEGLDAVVEPLNLGLWKRRIEGFYRYEGITDGEART